MRQEGPVLEATGTPGGNAQKMAGNERGSAREMEDDGPLVESK